MSINPTTDTLWVAAYGQNYPDRDEKALANRAAHSIIATAESELTTGKILLVVGAILLLISIIHFNHYSTASVTFGRSLLCDVAVRDGWQGFACLGTLLATIGSILWILNANDLDKYRFKPLNTISELLGDKLEKSRFAKFPNPGEEELFREDWNSLASPFMDVWANKS